MKKKTALFIMPRDSTAWHGSEALWITVAGWARAAKKLYPNTIVATRDRIAEPDEILDYPLGKRNEIKVRNKYRLLPDVLKTLLKDLKQYISSKRGANFQALRKQNLNKLEFVWEQHDVFPGPGRKIADQHNVPLIIYVHAPQVWEAKKWGVTRPFWGRFLEKFEAKNLNKAEVVACVSDTVSEKLQAMGISKNKIVVSPMAVDQELFCSTNTYSLRSQLNLDGRIVLGWTGSFRQFHGLDLLVQAFAKASNLNENLRLLLVGDGLERPKIESLVNELKLDDKVIFAGRQPFKKIPAYIASFDIAILSARHAGDFHYSPLKLREYLVSGAASLAPDAGEIPKIFEDGKHLMLYKIGNEAALVEKILNLANNGELRKRLGQQGRAYILEHGTWDHELSKVIKRISK